MLNLIIFLIWIHFFADFILQTDHQAINKSKNYWVLADHCFSYSGVLLVFWALWCFHYKGMSFAPALESASVFASVNFIAHFITDAVTSRVCRYLWEKEQRHKFFVVIGIDQALHMTVLVWSSFKILGAI